MDLDYYKKQHKIGSGTSSLASFSTRDDNVDLKLKVQRSGSVSSYIQVNTEWRIINEAICANYITTLNM